MSLCTSGMRSSLSTFANISSSAELSLHGCCLSGLTLIPTSSGGDIERSSKPGIILGEQAAFWTDLCISKVL